MLPQDVCKLSRKDAKELGVNASAQLRATVNAMCFRIHKLAAEQERKASSEAIEAIIADVVPARERGKYSGIMGAVVAHHVGARHVVITDVNEYRLDLAKKLGVKVDQETYIELSEHEFHGGTCFPGIILLDADMPGMLGDARHRPPARRAVRVPSELSLHAGLRPAGARVP